MNKLKVADLFSGIGGFSLGLERTGRFETITMCEKAPFARSVLAKHWPSVPCVDDIRSVRVVNCGVDVVCGGFPCQPFSTASRGRKVAENLWPEMARVVRLNMPKVVIAENVQEEAIRHAAADLRGYGYNITVRNISASDCGAPHARSRWWVVAHPYDEGEFQRSIDAEVAELPALCAGLWSAKTYASAIRIPHGLPTGVDERARIALGNAVLPQIPEAIGRAISFLTPTQPELGGQSNDT